MMNLSCAVMLDPLAKTVLTQFSWMNSISSSRGPFVEIDELADKGEHHETQVFYPHEFDLIDLDLHYTTTSRNGK